MVTGVAARVAPIRFQSVPTIFVAGSITRRLSSDGKRALK
jgi:hypothetical protein